MAGEACKASTGHAPTGHRCPALARRHQMFRFLPRIGSTHCPLCHPAGTSERPTLEPVCSDLCLTLLPGCDQVRFPLESIPAERSVKATAVTKRAAGMAPRPPLRRSLGIAAGRHLGGVSCSARTLPREHLRHRCVIALQAHEAATTAHCVPYRRMPARQCHCIRPSPPSAGPAPGS